MTDGTLQETVSQVVRGMPSIAAWVRWELLRKEVALYQRAGWIHRSVTGIPWYRRWKLWWRGFSTWDQVAYELDRNDPDNYLSFTGDRRTQLVDREWEELLRNKFFFVKCLSEWSELLPQMFGLVHKGVFIKPELSPKFGSSGSRNRRFGELLSGLEDHSGASEVLKTLVEALGDVIVKPVRGAVGTGVWKCGKIPGGYTLNGAEFTESVFENKVDSLENCIISEFVPQAPYLAELYPNSTNTLRVVTLYDGVTEDPYIVGGVQRIGTERSAPVDNFSKGGLSADIDLAQGCMGPGVRISVEQGRESYAEHPESGAVIEGRRVSKWFEICNTLKGLARHIPMVRWIGWDVLVTSDDVEGREFVVIEGNFGPDPDVLQVHKGILRDGRVRGFLKGCGVI